MPFCLNFGKNQTKNLLFLINHTENQNICQVLLSTLLRTNKQKMGTSMKSGDFEKLFADDPELLAFIKDASNSESILEQESETSVTTSESDFSKSEEVESFEHEESTQSRSTFSKIMNVIFNLLFYSIIIALLAGSTLFAFSNNPQKSYFGYRIYNVLTNSMVGEAEDCFNAGDIIIVKLTEPEEVEIGDIITFVPGRDERSYLTHRVVEVNHELNGIPGIYFVTRGDANNSDDPPISGSMLVGKKVFTISGMGAVIKFIRANFVITIIFVVATFAFIMLLRYYFAKPKEDLKDLEEEPEVCSAVANK